MHRLLIALVIFVAVPALAQPADPVDALFRQAYNAYKQGEKALAAQTLHQILDLVESHTSSLVKVDVLPEAFGEWKASAVATQDTTAAGAQLNRTYQKGLDTITVTVIKDSPMLRDLMQLLDNKTVLVGSGVETQKIGRETAVVEGGERDVAPRMRMGLDGKVYVEIVGSDKVRRSEIVSFARKLDLNQLAELE